MYIAHSYKLDDFKVLVFFILPRKGKYIKAEIHVHFALLHSKINVALTLFVLSASFYGQSSPCWDHNIKHIILMIQGIPVHCKNKIYIKISPQKKFIS